MARAVIQAPSKRAAVVSTTRTFISRIYNAATLGFAASCCRGWAGAISRRDGKLAAASPSYGGLEACRTHRRGRLACAVFSIEARDFTCCLAIDNPLFQIDACFVAVENAIVAKRFAIGDRFARHSARTSTSRNASCRAEDVPRTKRRPRNPRATRNPACQQ